MDTYYPALEQHLRELTAIPALTGGEEPMIRAVRDHLAGLGYQAQIDPLGNVLVQVGHHPSGTAPTVLLVAHTDEIGLIVRKIEKDGFLRCERAGGVPERVLPGLTMLVVARDGSTIPAVVGMKSHHLTEQDEKYRVVPVTEIYLDAGFRDRASAMAAGILPGCGVVYQRQFVRHETRVFSPALDDRAGCVILLQLADRLRNIALPCHLWLSRCA